MNIWDWFKSLWSRDATQAAVKAATTIANGLSSDQFHLIVDKVVHVSREPISGIEKANKVAAIVSDPIFSVSYRMPSWVREGVDVLTTIIKLAWFVAKATGRI